MINLDTIKNQTISWFYTKYKIFPNIDIPQWVCMNIKRIPSETLKNNLKNRKNNFRSHNWGPGPKNIELACSRLFLIGNSVCLEI